ncbi:hypothetical protein KKF84_19055, partial [Myxococcota bacterium]|nr:hypothetical protein [Myxococcota bacterium]
SQQAGQDFKDWSHKQLYELFEKLKHFGEHSIKHLQLQKHGKQHTLEVYGAFPAHSQFSLPAHVPDDVRWARFRLEGANRLIGFVVD